MINLEGKTALLTAAGQGIGKATARAFSEAGAYVIATDINKDSLLELDKFVDETHILDVTKQRNSILREENGRHSQNQVFGHTSIILIILI